MFARLGCKPEHTGLCFLPVLYFSVYTYLESKVCGRLAQVRRQFQRLAVGRWVMIRTVSIRYGLIQFIHYGSKFDSKCPSCLDYKKMQINFKEIPAPCFLLLGPSGTDAFVLEGCPLERMDKLHMKKPFSI